MLTSRMCACHSAKLELFKGFGQLEHREAQLRSSLIDVEDFEGDYSIAMAW